MGPGQVSSQVSKSASGSKQMMSLRPWWNRSASGPPMVSESRDSKGSVGASAMHQRASPDHDSSVAYADVMSILGAAMLIPFSVRRVFYMYICDVVCAN